METYFRQFAAYNRWANAWLFDAALALDENAYRRPLGVFFKSLHGTLNHILVTDEIWLGRILNQAPPEQHPPDTILHEDRDALAAARRREDERIIAAIHGFASPAFAAPVTYRNSSGVEFSQSLQDVLAHWFNHQTHHRGHAHACLSILGATPPALDLVAFQRGMPAPAPRNAGRNI